MKLLKNRMLAWIVYVAAALCSILIFGSGDLSAMRGETIATFDNIQVDLNARVDLAGNMLTIAGHYDGDSGLDQAVSEVDSARKRLINATDIAETYRLNAELTTACENLSAALGKLELTQADEGYRTGILVDMEAYDKIISHDAYNGLAADYNNRLDRFPASLMRALGLAKDAPLYSVD